MVVKQEGATNGKDPDYGKIRLFVYGTLKKKHCNNIVLRKAGAEFLGYDSIRIKGSFVDLGGFPALLYPLLSPSDGFETIRGEIWYGPQDMLKSTDILEGYPMFFNRSKQWSELHKRRVWVYHLGEDWLNEASDFVEDSMWNPENAEEIFWQEHVKAIKVQDNATN